MQGRCSCVVGDILWCIQVSEIPCRGRGNRICVDLMMILLMSSNFSLRQTINTLSSFQSSLRSSLSPEPDTALPVDEQRGIWVSDDRLETICIGDLGRVLISFEDIKN
jgi:hypothetical protein